MIKINYKCVRYNQINQLLPHLQNNKIIKKQKIRTLKTLNQKNNYSKNRKVIQKIIMKNLKKLIMLNKNLKVYLKKKY